jgi:hypothetical protein
LKCVAYMLPSIGDIFAFGRVCGACMISKVFVASGAQVLRAILAVLEIVVSWQASMRAMGKRALLLLFACLCASAIAGPSLGQSARPIILNVSPNTGASAGGTAVTLNGEFSNVSNVIFGDTAATSFQVLSGTQIRAVTPPGPAGPVTVAVLTSTGQAGVLPSGFSYLSDAALPTATVTALSANVNEDGPSNIIFTIRLSQIVLTDTFISYALSGSANASDYTGALPPSVRIPAGTQTANFQLNPTNDTTPEPNETVNFAITAGNGSYLVGSPSSATGLIINDDGPAVVPVANISVSPATVTEAGAVPLNFTVTLSQAVPEVTNITLGLSGTAVQGTDYSYTIPFATVTIPPNTVSVTAAFMPLVDTVNEPDETIIATILPSTGGPPLHTVGPQSSATGTIVNSAAAPRPVASISVAPAAVAEDGAANLIFTIALSAPASAATQVNLQIAGAGDFNTDYSGYQPSVLIPIGSSSTTLTINPTADLIREPDETVTVTIRDGPPEFRNFDISAQNSATGTITNDDTVSTSTATISFTGQTLIAENDTIGASYLVNIFPTRSEPTTINLTLSGTASGGTDVVALPTSIVIPADTSFVRFNVVPINETVIDADKTVIYAIATGTGYVPTAGTTTPVTIYNNDFPTANISIAPPTSVLEDSGQRLTYNITLSEPHPFAETRVKLTRAGAPTVGNMFQGGRFLPPTDEVIFPANNISQTVTFLPVADLTVEPDEIISISIAPITDGRINNRYVVGTSKTAVGLVLNDDTLAPKITNVRPLIGSAGINSPTPEIRIQGVNFLPQATVRIGGVKAPWRSSSAEPGVIYARPVAIPVGQLGPDGTVSLPITVETTEGIATSTEQVVLDGGGPIAAIFPLDVTVPTDAGKATAVVNYVSPIWIDYSDYEDAPTVGLPSESAFPVGVNIVTFKSTDIYNNSSTHVLTITVQDNELPVFAGVPTNISLSTDPALPSAIATWVAPTATDNVGVTSLTQIAGPANGGALSIGVTTVTYVARDAAGNAASTSFTITVLDGEKPVLVGMPAMLSVSTDPGLPSASVTWVEPTATDNSGNVTVTRETGPAPGSPLPIGITTISYLARDAAGNETRSSFTVTVRDSELPVLVGIPANITVSTDTGMPTALVTWAMPTATDNAPGVTLRQTEGPARGAAFPIGVTRVTYVASDAAGNNASATFTVTVADKEPPTIIGLSPNLSFDIDYPNTTRVVTWAEPTARDNVPGATITQTVGPKSGSAFPVGVTTVTYEAKDVAGNITASTFTVTVKATPPGSITFILESQDGGAFSVAGGEPALNASMTASPGRSSMNPILIRPGSYPISFSVPNGAGIIEASCTAGGSALNIASKTGTIVLTSGQAVTCTIKTLASQRVATETVATLFEARQALILANQPSTDRRINRLIGRGAAGDGSINLGGLQFANKSPFNVSIDRDGRASFNYSSLRARQLSNLASAADPTGGDVDATRLPGSKRTGLDFWAEGTLAKFEIGKGDGNFAILHVGADYLATKNLLIGATAQLDWIDFDTTGDATTKGKGFMAGPYITARLSESLFFDARVTAGTASNDISPYGTYVDSVDSNRTLTSAALIGSFQRGDMTIRPEARLNWFVEESDAYKDSLGVMVPSVRSATGTLDIGPELRWSLGAKELGDVEFSVGLAGIWAFDQTLKSDANIALERLLLPDFRGRLKSGTLLTLENGVVFNADLFIDGIGGGDYRSWGGSLGIRLGF